MQASGEDASSRGLQGEKVPCARPGGTSGAALALLCLPLGAALSKPPTPLPDSEMPKHPPEPTEWAPERASGFRNGKGSATWKDQAGG